MTELISATTSPSLETSIIELVVSFVALILVMVLLILDLRYIRESRRIAKNMDLPKGQWLRLVRTLMFDPIIELLAIGLLLAADVVQNWEHAVAALLGVAVGVWVGHYRFRIQYVRAVPEHKAIVFVRSRAEYIALTILLVVDFASEQHQIPAVGPLTLFVTLGLAVVVAESVSRAWFSYRQYVHDTAVTPARV